MHSDTALLRSFSVIRHHRTGVACPSLLTKTMAFQGSSSCDFKGLFLDSLGTHSNIFQILKRFHFHFHLGLHLLADALLLKGQLAKMIFPFPCRGPSWISPLALGARSMIWMVMRMVIHDDRYEYHNYGILWENNGYSIMNIWNYGILWDNIMG